MTRTYYKKTCMACGKKFLTRDTRFGKGRYCSHICSGTISSLNRNQKGEANNNWKGGISIPYSIRKKRYTQKHPERALAHRLLTNAIRRKEIAKLPCQKCGDEKVEGHHKDYFKPLEVVWLCKKHHLEEHNKRFNN